MSVYLKPGRERVTAVVIAHRCGKEAPVSIRYSGNARVSDSGKFDVNVKLSIRDAMIARYVKSRGRITGRFKDGKKYISLKYSLDGRRL